MTRFRRLGLTVLVGVLVTLPTAGSALAQLPTTNDPRVGLSPGFDNPSVSAAVFDGVNIDKPGRPSIGLGNQGGGMDDVAGFDAILPFIEQDTFYRANGVADASWGADFDEGDGEDFLDEDQARRAGPRAYTATVGTDSRTRDFVDNLDIYLLSLSVSGSTGSSHREAMQILKDPTSDYAAAYYEPGSVSPFVQ